MVNNFVVHVAGQEIVLEDHKESKNSVILLQEEIGKDCYGLSKMKFKPKDIIIDIGAHIGSVSIILAKLNPQIKIYAFEPAKITYDLLCKNLEANNIRNVTPIKAAISDYIGEMEFCFNPMDTAGSSGCYTPAMTKLFTQYQWKKEKVQVWNMKKVFDDLNIERAAWVKMDCEGAEYQIFNDENNQFDKIDKISLEIHFPISQFARGTEAIKRDFYEMMGINDSQPELDIVNINWMIDSNG